MCCLPKDTTKKEQAVDVDGWIIGNSDRDLWSYIDHGCPGWTKVATKALRFARREDAEAFAAENEDAWCIILLSELTLCKHCGKPVDLEPILSAVCKKDVYVHKVDHLGHCFGENLKVLGTFATPAEKKISDNAKQLLKYTEKTSCGHAGQFIYLPDEDGYRCAMCELIDQRQKLEFIQTQNRDLNDACLELTARAQKAEKKLAKWWKFHGITDPEAYEKEFERRAKVAATKVLRECAGRYVHPDGYKPTPQEMINAMIELAADIIVDECSL